MLKHRATTGETVRLRWENWGQKMELQFRTVLLASRRAFAIL